jgi:hypothetical protein
MGVDRDYEATYPGEATGGPPSPARLFAEMSDRRALDELFEYARRYRTGEEYQQLLAFVSRFRFYAPFNAMLVHLQMNGATYVAPPHRWLQDFRRRIRPGARPLVILQPMGPVMLVYDVSNTEPLPDAPPLPRAVTDPFTVRSGHIGPRFDTTIGNARRDGVNVVERDAGSQSAGQISVVKRPDPWRYELLLNCKHAPEAKYATLAHELGHLYCGHLGTPNARWWPDRRGLNRVAQEIEAESVCYLVCQRLGLDNPSGEYLSTYLSRERELPETVSVDRIMKVVGLIESMAQGRLKPRNSGSG